MCSYSLDNTESNASSGFLTKKMYHIHFYISYNTYFIKETLFKNFSSSLLWASSEVVNCLVILAKTPNYFWPNTNSFSHIV